MERNHRVPHKQVYTKDDKKANKGTHIYTYDELNRMVSSEIAKELTNYTCDTLGNLALATGRNKRVDYK